LNEFSKINFDDFFIGISAWRSAYKHAALSFFGIRKNGTLEIISARINLGIASSKSGTKANFRAGKIEAGQWKIPQSRLSVEKLVEHLTSDSGQKIPGFGNVRMGSNDRNELFVAPPNLLHSEGLNTGNRLSVLSLKGLPCQEFLPQPESDWALKGAETPYDSIQELCFDYGVSTLRDERALLEIVAHKAVEVLDRSEVSGTSATIGIWMASTLDKKKARLGYRVLQANNVVSRASIPGSALTWNDHPPESSGTFDLTIPAGSGIQCIATYSDVAHHVQWRADPSIFHNPRAAVLSLIDPQHIAVKGYLQPELPPRGRSADDFEAAIAWVLWTLGFATATFGTNAKTRDAFDTVAVSPNGDFLVIECTLGLLRSDSKLAKLTSRTVKLREVLDASNMRHIRILPVIVTAMTIEQVRADISSAEEIGVLVLARENLDEISQTLRQLPDANALFERAVRSVQERKAARQSAKSLVHLPHP
jgi:hypothetical protein